MSREDASDMRPTPASSSATWRWRVALAGFVGVALYFLVTEHAAHLMGALPYLLLLACPLMHLFHHRGHAGHGRHEGEPR